MSLRDEFDRLCKVVYELRDCFGCAPKETCLDADELTVCIKVSSISYGQWLRIQPVLDKNRMAYNFTCYGVNSMGLIIYDRDRQKDD